MAEIHRADVTLHVDETLEKETRENLEKDLLSLNGVADVSSSKKAPHLMIVSYDPRLVRSKDILGVVRGDHLRAELIG